MSYSISIVTTDSESIADFASNRGLKEFRQAVESGSYPELQAFIDEGWTVDIEEVIQELESLHQEASSDVQSSIAVIQGAIEEVRDSIIEAMVLGNGVSNEQNIDETE